MMQYEASPHETFGDCRECCARTNETSWICCKVQAMQTSWKQIYSVTAHENIFLHKVERSMAIKPATWFPFSAPECFSSIPSLRHFEITFAIIKVHEWMTNSSSEEEASATSINSEVYGCAIERNWVSATFEAEKHELNKSSHGVERCSNGIETDCNWRSMKSWRITFCSYVRRGEVGLGRFRVDWQSFENHERAKF